MTLEAPTDGRLVEQTVAGDVDAYRILVERYSARVVALCHARVGRDSAEDLAQETFLRGFRSLARLTDAAKFSTWILSIASHICLDWHKRERRRRNARPRLEQIAGERVAAPRVGRELERTEDAEALLAAIDGLPQPLREVILLFYYEDKGYRSIAETLSVSVATVNLRLARARELLRARLERSLG